MNTEKETARDHDTGLQLQPLLAQQGPGRRYGQANIASPADVADS